MFKYEIIAEDLQKKIQSGEYRADEKLPQEMELCRQYDTSRITIREALDKNGFAGMPIMAYSAKFASSFYGPFRDAADSAPAFGDRKSYQMDYHNRREALKEALLDEEEGADIVMVKPAMAYADLIREVRELVKVPVAAYSVSGEYAMIKAAAAAGFLDEEQAVMETAACAYRAGADIYISYYAKELAGYMKEGKLG